MDELKIVSKFTKNIISKFIIKAVHKKFGCNIAIQLGDLSAIVNDGKVQVHLNADVELEKDELTKLLKSVGVD